jgi:TetR/AcrR family transcriptional regulator, ethionamide resistance regulator
MTSRSLSSRGRRSRRPSGDDRERDILTTAERLLGERPLSQISVDDLARGAGISRPTFYFYFSSKESVMLSLLDGVVAEAQAARLSALERAGDDARELSRQALAAIHDTFRSHRAVSITAAGLFADDAEVRTQWLTVMQGFVADTVAAIESERARGAAPPGPPPRDLAIALNWMNERALLASFSGWDPSITEDQVLDTVLIVWSRAIYGDDRLVGGDSTKSALSPPGSPGREDPGRLIRATNPSGEPHSPLRR